MRTFFSAPKISSLIFSALVLLVPMKAYAQDEVLIILSNETIGDKDVVHENGEHDTRGDQRAGWLVPEGTHERLPEWTQYRRDMCASRPAGTPQADCSPEGRDARPSIILHIIYVSAFMNHEIQ